MGTEERVEVLVRYQDMEIRLTGSVDDVIRAFLQFMGRVIPNYELASGLTLTVDLERLLRGLEGVIAVTPEGMILTIDKERISERDLILLHLAKTYIGHQLGRLERDSLFISNILSLTGGKPSTTAARLSELVDLDWVERVGRGEYRITTYGVTQFQDQVLPKIKP
ncbi:MAG: hypothetical protein ACE5Z5_12405 [Candidatus Bathyarchaeia archaeon]